MLMWILSLSRVLKVGISLVVHLEVVWHIFECGPMYTAFADSNALEQNLSHEALSL